MHIESGKNQEVKLSGVSTGLIVVMLAGIDLFRSSAKHKRANLPFPFGHLNVDENRNLYPSLAWTRATPGCYSGR
jgi:hypothetical protein